MRPYTDTSPLYCRGEEVYNTYGALSNADLLRGYGFVEADNINEHAQVGSRGGQEATFHNAAGRSHYTIAEGGRTAGRAAILT